MLYLLVAKRKMFKNWMQKVLQQNLKNYGMIQSVILHYWNVNQSQEEHIKLECI